MGDLDRIRSTGGSVPTRRPTPTPPPEPTPTPAPGPTPRPASDTARLVNRPTTSLQDQDHAVYEKLRRAQAAADPAPDAGKPDAVQNAWDQETLFAGVQTVAQGTAQGAAQAARTSRTLNVLSKVLNGDTAELTAKVARTLGRATSTGLSVGGRLSRLATPAVNGMGSALAFVGKVAPVLNVLAAVNDTRKAHTEKDPEAQKTAWANAGLSWGSTALAVGSVAVAGTVAAAAATPLAVGAAVIAGAQLADTFLFGGRGTKWVAENTPIGDWTKSATKAVLGMFD